METSSRGRRDHLLCSWTQDLIQTKGGVNIKLELNEKTLALQNGERNTKVPSL